MRAKGYDIYYDQDSRGYSGVSMVNYAMHPQQAEHIVAGAYLWWRALQSLAGNGVLPDTNDPNGLKVTRTSATEVAIAAGHYGKAGIWTAHAGGSIDSIPAAAEGKHRYDVIAIQLSTGSAVRVAGSEAVPDLSTDFLENYTPRPADLNSTDYLQLAIICVDEDGIRSGDNGTYSTAGVADIRTPFMAALDNDTLKIETTGKMYVGGGIYRVGPIRITHDGGASQAICTTPAFCDIMVGAIKCVEATDTSTVDLGWLGSTDILMADADVPKTLNGTEVVRFPTDSITAAKDVIATMGGEGTVGEWDVWLGIISFT
jgi:hypothetical protein